MNGIQKRWIKESVIFWKLSPKSVVSYEGAGLLVVTLSTSCEDSSAGLRPGQSLGTVTERSPLSMLLGHWIDLYAVCTSQSTRSESNSASFVRHKSRGFCNTTASATSDIAVEIDRLSSSCVSPDWSSVAIVQGRDGACSKAQVRRK